LDVLNIYVDEIVLCAMPCKNRPTVQYDPLTSLGLGTFALSVIYILTVGMIIAPHLGGQKPPILGRE